MLYYGVVREQVGGGQNGVEVSSPREQIQTGYGDQRNGRRLWPAAGQQEQDDGYGQQSGTAGEVTAYPLPALDDVVFKIEERAGDGQDDEGQGAGDGPAGPFRTLQPAIQRHGCQPDAG